jgi:hypothetical protein
MRWLTEHIARTVAGREQIAAAIERASDLDAAASRGVDPERMGPAL